MASDGEILDYKDLLNKFNLTDEFYPLVYVCSPYRGNIEENTRKAREYSLFERNIAIHKINYVLLGLCKEVWVFGDVITEGMKREISVAKKRKKPIRYFNHDLKEES